nr:MAG TPA: hypothetical protein [Caudoviricetes sp.]
MVNSNASDVKQKLSNSVELSLRQYRAKLFKEE